MCRWDETDWNQKITISIVCSSPLASNEDSMKHHSLIAIGHWFSNLVTLKRLCHTQFFLVNVDIKIEDLLIFQFWKLHSLFFCCKPLGFAHDILSFSWTRSLMLIQADLIRIRRDNRHARNLKNKSFQALKADPVSARSDKSPSERDHARYPRDAASHEWHDVNVDIWPWKLARKVRSNMKINKRDCVASSRSNSSRVISVRRARWMTLSLSSHYIIIFIMSNYIHWFFKFELFY